MVKQVDFWGNGKSVSRTTTDFMKTGVNVFMGVAMLGAVSSMIGKLF